MGPSAITPSVAPGPDAALVSRSGEKPIGSEQASARGSDRQRYKVAHEAVRPYCHGHEAALHVLRNLKYDLIQRRAASGPSGILHRRRLVAHEYFGLEHVSWKRSGSFRAVDRTETGSPQHHRVARVRGLREGQQAIVDILNHPGTCAVAGHREDPERALHHVDGDTAFTMALPL